MARYRDQEQTVGLASAKMAVEDTKGEYNQIQDLQNQNAKLQEIIVELEGELLSCYRKLNGYS